MTGLAQISGRNSISWEEKFKDDLEYVHNVTMINDIKIILKTVIKVVKRDNVLMGTELPVGKLNVIRSKQNAEVIH